jgi:hypothetical protein
MSWEELVVRMEEGRCVRNVLVGKPEEKITLGRPRRRWENNIKRDVQEVGRCLGIGRRWLRIVTGDKFL